MYTPSGHHSDILLKNVSIVHSFILSATTNGEHQTAHGNTQPTYRENIVQKLKETFTSREQVGRKKNLTEQFHLISFRKN
jgi:hypothetical protein